MNKLVDAFRSDDAHVWRSMLFVDFTASTAAKQTQPEAAWLPTLGLFFDVVNDVLAKSVGGRIVKYLGDGAMAVFDDNSAAEAINAAIDIQEEMARMNKDGRMVGSCSIAVTTGEVVRFCTPGDDEHEDYVGTVVDRAFRLCSAASPQAVFIDAVTITSAPMNKVRATLGRALRRSPNDYQGDLQSLSLKGFSAAVDYYEILWDAQRYGVKSEVPTSAVRNAAAAISAPGAVQTPSDRRSLKGQVSSWRLDQARGWVSSEGEDFFCSAVNLIGATELKPGSAVVFAPHDALIPGKNRLATCVMSVGSMGEGLLERVIDKGDGRALGFVRVADSYGNSVNIVAYLDDNPNGLEEGDAVQFEVGDNRLGAVALRANKVDAAA